MVRNTIDLRPRTDSVSSRPQQQADIKTGTAFMRWEALEYKPPAVPAFTVLCAGVVAIGFVVFGLFTASYFFAGFVALAYVVALLYTFKTPHRVSFSVSQEEIAVGTRKYPFSAFKSFCLFQSSGADTLCLVRQKKFAPFLFLPLGDADVPRLREILAATLPEEQQEEPASHIIARNIGF